MAVEVVAGAAGTELRGVPAMKRRQLGQFPPLVGDWILDGEGEIRQKVVAPVPALEEEDAAVPSTDRAP